MPCAKNDGVMKGAETRKARVSIRKVTTGAIPLEEDEGGRGWSGEGRGGEGEGRGGKGQSIGMLPHGQPVPRGDVTEETAASSGLPCGSRICCFPACIAPGPHAPLAETTRTGRVWDCASHPGRRESGIWGWGGGGGCVCGWGVGGGEGSRDNRNRKGLGLSQSPRETKEWDMGWGGGGVCVGGWGGGDHETTET